MALLKNKRWILTFLLFAVLLVAVFVFFAPRPIAKDAERISSIRITYMDEEISSFDESEVKPLLSQVRCHRVFTNYFPLYMDDVVFEIRFLYDKKVVHMVLGKDNFCYQSADDLWVSALIDGEAIRSDLQRIIQ